MNKESVSIIFTFACLMSLFMHNSALAYGNARIEFSTHNIDKDLRVNSIYEEIDLLKDSALGLNDKKLTEPKTTKINVNNGLSPIGPSALNPQNTDYTAESKENLKIKVLTTQIPETTNQ